ncbi:hypothetical protein QR680_011589 [Steinernema hermaphroditum]|uniref:Uncharacterized protein n=1 Tax=Steinernema hermaphroditum TaxID=289476 RepID=A0AA39I1M3_9BILA|nr:hypothetical protein QR680_011589 [Steinernema hermaphroditum]
MHLLFGILALLRFTAADHRSPDNFRDNTSFSVKPMNSNATTEEVATAESLGTVTSFPFSYAASKGLNNSNSTAISVTTDSTFESYWNFSNPVIVGLLAFAGVLVFIMLSWGITLCVSIKKLIDSQKNAEIRMANLVPNTFSEEKLDEKSTKREVGSKSTRRLESAAETTSKGGDASNSTKGLESAAETTSRGRDASTSTKRLESASETTSKRGDGSKSTRRLENEDGKLEDASKSKREDDSKSIGGPGGGLKSPSRRENGSSSKSTCGSGSKSLSKQEHVSESTRMAAMSASNREDQGINEIM